MPPDTEPRFEEIADELYSLPLDAFMAARDGVAAQARSDGDRALSTRLKALRRPTRSAWLVNQLVRERGEIVDELAEIGTALREAERTLTGAALRQLGTQRSKLVASLVAAAAALAGSGGPPTSEMLGEVQTTLEAALADPEAAAEVRAGRLTRPLSYTGYEALTSPRPVAHRPAAVKNGPARSDRDRSRDRAAERRAELESERKAVLAAAQARLRAAKAATRNTAAAAERAERERAGLTTQLELLRARVSDLERRSAEAALDARRTSQAAAAAAQEFDAAQADVERSERDNTP